MPKKLEREVVRSLLGALADSPAETLAEVAGLLGDESIRARVTEYRLWTLRRMGLVRLIAGRGYRITELGAHRLEDAARE